MSTEPEAASVVWIKELWKQSKCFWSFPFGHRWQQLGIYDKECARCKTWRKW